MSWLEFMKHQREGINQAFAQGMAGKQMKIQSSQQGTAHMLNYGSVKEGMEAGKRQREVQEEGLRLSGVESAETKADQLEIAIKAGEWDRARRIKNLLISEAKTPGFKSMAEWAKGLDIDNLKSSYVSKTNQTDQSNQSIAPKTVSKLTPEQKYFYNTRLGMFMPKISSEDISLAKEEMLKTIPEEVVQKEPPMIEPFVPTQSRFAASERQLNVGDSYRRFDFDQKLKLRGYTNLRPGAKDFLFNVETNVLKALRALKPNTIKRWGW